MTSMAGQNDENENSDIAKMNNTEGPKEPSESADSGKENGSSTNEAKNNNTSKDFDTTGISASIVQAKQQRRLKQNLTQHWRRTKMIRSPPYQ